MGLSVNISNNYKLISRFGRSTVKTGTIAFNNSYPTNGEPLLASQVGIKTIDQIKISSNSGYTFEYNAAASKIKVFYGEYTSGSKGPLKEVPNGGDISSLSAVPFEVVGNE